MTQFVEEGALFGLDDQGGFVMPVEELAPVVAEAGPYANLSPAEQAFVDLVPDAMPVAARASHLSRALTEISRANSRGGFVYATQTEAHRPEIEERYGDSTDVVAEGAACNALTGERRAHYEFFAASGVGYLALQNRRPVPADGMDTATPEDWVYMAMNKSWREFRSRYGGTGNAINTRRKAYKKLLDKQIEYTHEGIDS